MFWNLELLRACGGSSGFPENAGDRVGQCRNNLGLLSIAE